MNDKTKNRSLATIGTITGAALVGGLVIAAAPTSAATASTEVVEALGALTTSESSNTAGDRLPNGMAVPISDFEITALFGNSSGPHAGRSHGGLDLAAPSGTPIVSATAGKVIQAGPSGGYGNLVTVKSDTGHTVLYAHLSKVSVKKGDKVEAGQKLGLEGSTGNSTGPHLHLEVHGKGGKKIDPLTFLGVTKAQLAKYGK